MSRLAVWCGILATLCMAVVVYGGIAVVTARMAHRVSVDTVPAEWVQAP